MTDTCKLHAMYGEAVFESVRWAARAEQLRRDIEDAAREAAYTVTAAETQPESVETPPAHIANAPLGPSVGRAVESAAEGQGLPPIVLSQVRRGKYRNLFAVTAKKLGLTSVHVYKVGHGRETSPRVLDALHAAIAAIDAAGDVSPLSDEERRLFQHFGRCRGGMSRVATKLHIQRTRVSSVARGKGYNRAIILALRAEIAMCPPVVDDCLSEYDLQMLGRGKPCYGLLSAIARSHNCHHTRVRRVALGQSHDADLLADIRAQIRARIAGGQGGAA